jgi:hypothetical protein
MGWPLGSAKSIAMCRLATFNKWEKSFLRDGENHIGRVRGPMSVDVESLRCPPFAGRGFHQQGRDPHQVIGEYGSAD